LGSRAWPALEVVMGAAFDRLDLFQAALADYDVTAIDDASDRWRIFFHTTAERDRAAEALRDDFAELAFERIDVPDEDWAARSQAALRAVRIGKIVVAPPWDVPPRGHTDDVVIVIRPSMGFGTGHHATTRLCLDALQHLDLLGRSVMDVGTGSGVLAIASSFLGAAPVVGIDDDEDAIAAARDNRELNPHASVSLEVGDLRTYVVSGFSRSGSDVVLANLTGALLVSAAADLQHLTKPGGRLILGGFLTAQESDVLRAFAPLTVEHRGEEEEWLCVTLR